MINEILLNQKREKEKLLSGKYVERKELAHVKNLTSQRLIKVILGPRRAGKSVFSFLLLKDKNFAYVNFDDDNLIKVENTEEIIKSISEVYNNPHYLFFDEIQNLPRWELFLNKLHRRGYNIIVTGSNAKLLSKELSTHLTGRHIPIEIFPFSFSEILLAKEFKFDIKELVISEKKGTFLSFLNEYNKEGGFPEIVTKKASADAFLTNLYDSVLLKDVVSRYNLRFAKKIDDLSSYLASNFSSEYSFRKLKNILDFNSIVTLQNYLNYLEESYLVISLNRYSTKTKEQINAPRKIYFVDNGFITAKSFQQSENFGKKIENLFFTELLKKGYKPNHNIFYYRTRNQREVDFVIKEGYRVKNLIQVCYKLDYDTEKREIKALIEAAEELRCNNLLVITWDNEKIARYGKKKIHFIPLWKWILEV